MKASALLIALIYVPLLPQQPDNTNPATQGLTIPTCKTHSSAPRWGPRIVDKNTLRFNVDDSKGDPCTVYYDLEFVVEMIGADSKSLGRQRFAVPNAEIRGPVVEHYDFQYDLHNIAKAKPIVLACSTRFIGGLPGPDRDQSGDTGADFALERELRQEGETDWISNMTLDYQLTYIYNSTKMVCESGEIARTVEQSDPVGCADALHAAQNQKDKRSKEIGPAILYKKPLSPR